MSWGFQTFDANGNMLVDASMPISRIYDSFTVASGVSGNRTYPDLAGRKFAVIATPINTGTFVGARHKVTVNLGTGHIQWDSAVIGGIAAQSNTVILVIMYG